MAYFPLFVNLKDRDVLVIGGGKIACRRIRTLFGFGCRICVVSPKLCDELQILYKEEKLVWKEKSYERTDLFERPVFVLSAAGREVDFQVVKDCRELGIPVNNASDKELCDFYFPGLARKEDLVAGVTASGTDHKKAAEFTAALRRLMEETSY